MGTDQLIPVVDDGLGNSAYLLDLGDGRALAVDPSRDLRKVYGAAARCGLRVAYAAETHLHADFVSGARQLHADHDAATLGSAAGERVFDHVRLGEGDEIDLGGLTLRAMQTPGRPTTTPGTRPATTRPAATARSAPGRSSPSPASANGPCRPPARPEW